MTSAFNVNRESPVAGALRLLPTTTPPALHMIHTEGASTFSSRKELWPRSGGAPSNLGAKVDLSSTLGVMRTDSVETLPQPQLPVEETGDFAHLQAPPPTAVVMDTAGSAKNAHTMCAAPADASSDGQLFGQDYLVAISAEDGSALSSVLAGQEALLVLLDGHGPMGHHYAVLCGEALRASFLANWGIFGELLTFDTTARAR